MKKKTGSILAITVLLITSIAFAAATYTTHYNLAKPGKGDANWHTSINSNMDTIDSRLHGLGEGISESYRMVVYPENYGTQGDGNDSDIVRLALDAVRATGGGGEIYINNCEKDWKFNASLRNISGVTVRGCARAYTTDASTAPNNGHPWKAADPTQPIITIGDSQNSTRKTRGIIIRDFWMDGSQDNATTGIWLQEGSDVLIDNFDIKGMTHDAVKIGDANSTNVFDSDTVTFSNFTVFLGQQRGTQVVTGFHFIYHYAKNYIGWPHLLSGQIWEPQSSSLTVDDPSLSYAIYNRGVGLVMTDIYIGTSTTRGFYLDQPVGVVIGANSPPCTIWMNGVYLENNGQLACPGDPTNCHVSIKNAYNDQGPMAIFRGIGELSGKFETAGGETTGGILQTNTKSYQYIAKIYTPLVYNYLGFFGTTYVGSVHGSEDNGTEPNRRVAANDSTWDLDFTNLKAGAGFKFAPGDGGYTKVKHLHADNTTATFGYDQGTSITVHVGAGKYGIQALAATNYTEDSVPIYAYTSGDQQAMQGISEYGHGVTGAAYRSGVGVDGVTDNGTGVRGRSGIYLGGSTSPTYSSQGLGSALRGEAYGDNAYLLSGWTTSNTRGAINVHVDALRKSDNDTVLPMTVFKRYLNSDNATLVPDSGIGFEHKSIIHNQAKDNEFVAARHKIYLRNVTTDNETTVQEFLNNSQGAEVTALKLDGPNLISGGTISGKIPMITKSADYALGTDSAQEAYGYMVWMSGANKILTLPAVAAGMSVCLYSTDATAKVIDPNANDGIRNGTASRNADGHKITSSGAAGDFACLIADSADGWTVMGKSGTWTDE